MINKKNIHVSIATQKGGVGKSAMTTLIASILHYRMGYNVAVFDCDFPQWSIFKMRERDTQSVIKSEHFKRMAYEQFSSIDKKGYPVVPCKPDDCIAKAENFIQNAPISYDFLFFDLPGTLNSPGIIRTISKMDYIFSPIIADRFVLESALSFMNVLNNVLVKGGKTSIKGINLFWNMVDGREKTELYTHYENVIKELGLSLMNTYIPDRKHFRKELSVTMEKRPISRSTLFPIDKRLNKSLRMDDFITEFLHITLN